MILGTDCEAQRWMALSVGRVQWRHWPSCIKQRAGRDGGRHSRAKTERPGENRVVTVQLCAWGMN